jgi:hypothetical protein
VVTWARDAGHTDVAALWSACPRGDWLLGIGVRLGAVRNDLLLAASAAAHTALDFMPDGDARGRRALEVLESFARGNADAEAVGAARGSVEALSEAAPDPAVEAAAQAVLAALASIDDPTVAPGAASLAAQAAVFDAGDCAMMAALRFAQEKAATAVRDHLTPAWAASTFASLDPPSAEG